MGKKSYQDFLVLRERIECLELIEESTALRAELAVEKTYLKERPEVLFSKAINSRNKLFTKQIQLCRSEVSCGSTEAISGCLFGSSSQARE